MKFSKTIPWITVLAVLKVLLDHYLQLSEEDRQRINQVIKESKALPHRITPQHKEHIKIAAANLNKSKLGKDLFSAVAPIPSLPKGRKKQA